MSTTNLISKGEAARRLGGVSEKTVDRLRTRGLLRSKVVGERRIGIYEDSLERYLQDDRHDEASLPARPAGIAPAAHERDVPERGTLGSRARAARPAREFEQRFPITALDGLRAGGSR